MPTRPLAARSYTAAMMRTCSVILALTLVAACGQKGPLYRADEKAEAVAAPGESAPEISTDEKKKAPVTAPLPDPQSPAETSTPTDPTPAPPAVDPDRPATPPPGN